MKALRFIRAKIPTQQRIKINRHIEVPKTFKRHLFTDPAIIKTQVISRIDYTKNITIPKDCASENINVYVNSIKPLLSLKRDRKDLGFEDDIKRNFHIKINFEGKNVVTKEEQHKKYEFTWIEDILCFSFFVSLTVIVCVCASMIPLIPYP